MQDHVDRTVLVRECLRTTQVCRGLQSLPDKLAQLSACLLASIGRRDGSIDSYVEAMQAREQQTLGSGSAACAAIWKADTLAYRCRTCQVNDNCAICKDCFQAGDHTNHDYSMYFSSAGGCCDCGDPTSWKPAGFCSRHTGHTNQQHQQTLQLDQLEEMTARAVICWVVQGLSWALDDCVRPAVEADRAKVRQAQAEKAAPVLISWLQKLCNVPTLRKQVSSILLRRLLYGRLRETELLLTTGIAFSYSDFSEDFCSRYDLYASHLSVAGQCGAPQTTLDWWLGDFAQVRSDIMQEMMTTLLQLLFDSNFKEEFTVIMLKHYDRLMEELSVKPTQTVMPLEMITVQLFNDEKSTAAVEGLLDTLMSTLIKLTTTAVVSQATSPAQLIASRTYTRILQDIRMVLIHPWAVAELLTCHMAILLEAVSLVDRFQEYERKLGSHAEWGNDAWLKPVQFETIMLSQTLLPVLAGVLDTRHLDMTLAQLCKVLVNSLKCLCHKVQHDCKPEYATQHGKSGKHCGSCCIWNHLLTGGLVSMHIPRQRAVALLVKAILALCSQAMAGGKSADVEATEMFTLSSLGHMENLEDTQEAAAPVSFQALAQPALMLQVWRAQVGADLWVRNGPEVGQLHHIYQSPYWNDTSLDLDLLLLQLWLAQAEPNEALSDFTRAFGGEGIVQAAWGLTRLSSELPPMPPCPALAGWEPNPTQALHTLRQRSIVPGDALASDGTSFIPDRFEDSDMASDANRILLEPVTVPEAAETLPRSQPIAWWHGPTAAMALFSPSDPRLRQAGSSEGPATADAGSSADDREQVKAGAPPTADSDASVSAELVLEPGTATRDTVSDKQDTEASQLHATATMQRSSPDASKSDSQADELRAGLESGEVAAIQRLLGEGSVGVPEAQLSCIVQGMRLLVMLLRNDHTWQPDARKQLRWHLVQRLCQKDLTYTELQDTLSSQLASQHAAFDQVLEEVAMFVNPSSLQRGHYCLKKEMWADFDPYYPQYTVRARQVAIDRGLEEKLWKPHQQLNGFPHLMPAGIDAMQGLSTCTMSIRLIECCLAYSQRHPSTAADDLAIAALNLLALSVHACTGKAEAAVFAGLQTTVMVGVEAEACKLASIPDQLKAIANSEAGQHSFELQDCARHMHGNLTQLTQRHHLSPAAATDPEASSANAQQTAHDDAKAGVAAVAAAGSKRAQAKARQAAMMAKMRQQQAQFKEQDQEAASDDDSSKDEMTQSPEQASVVTAESPAAAPPSQQAGLGAQAIEGECAFCCGGNEAEPLGWVAQVHCCAVASFANQPPPAWQNTPCDPHAAQPVAREACASMLDEQAGPSVLCCGHMLHASCLARHRVAMDLQQVEDEFLEGGDLLDLDSREYLCPVCRRLGTTLLPALAPLPQPLLVQPDQTTAPPRGLPDQALQHSSEGSLANQALEAQLQAMLQTIDGMMPAESIAQPQSGSARGRAILTSQLQIAAARWGVYSPNATDFVNLVHKLTVNTTREAHLLLSDEQTRAQQGEAAAAGANLQDPAPTLNSFQPCTTAESVQGSSKSQLLWSTWAHNVAAWECQHRPATSAPDSEWESIQTAEWRGMQSLACLCLAFGTGKAALPGFSSHSLLAAQLRWLTATDTDEDAAIHGLGFAKSLSPLVFLPSRATDSPLPQAYHLYSKADSPPLPAAANEAAEMEASREWRQLMRDPFALLMHLFALAVSPQAESAASPGSHGSANLDMACSNTANKLSLFQALTRLVSYMSIAQAAEFRMTAENAAPAEFDQAVAPHVLPFLRRAYVVECQMTSLPASETYARLQCCHQTDSDNRLEGDDKAFSTLEQLKVLQDRLTLPSPAAAMRSLRDSHSFHELRHRWVIFPGVQPAGDDKEHALQQRQQLLPVPHLMQLPNQFQDLFLHLTQAVCCHCGKQPKEGALCLQCGTLMCAGDTKCRHPNKQGRCKPHAIVCGGGTCAFLLMKMTKVLLISASRACLAPSPYLDSHGEEDLYLNRGRPLHLNQQRFARLNQLWSASAFDFDSPTFHDAFGGNAWRAAQYW